MCFASQMDHSFLTLRVYRIHTDLDSTVDG